MGNKIVETAYIEYNEDGNVIGWSTSPSNNKSYILEYNPENMPEVLLDPLTFKVLDGKLVQDMELKNTLISEYERYKNKPTVDCINTALLGDSDNYHKEKVAYQVNKALGFLTTNLTESQVIQVPDIVPKWEADKKYTIGERVSYGKDDNGKVMLFEIAQSHTSQENWDPKSTHSLYKQIGVTDSGYDIWTQPYGSEDAYNVGDIVFHNKILYISVKDNNVWEPGVYGWKEYE